MVLDPAQLIQNGISLSRNDKVMYWDGTHNRWIVERLPMLHNTTETVMLFQSPNFDQAFTRLLGK